MFTMRKILQSDYNKRCKVADTAARAEYRCSGDSERDLDEVGPR